MSENGRQVVLRGGCQCGAVRYALYVQPVGSICHCRMCQKAMGGPFAALATVNATDIVWTKGGPAIFKSSSLAQRGFCAACGTPLTYQGVDRSKLEVTMGSLDSPSAVLPMEQFGIESQVSWFTTLPALPGIPTEAKYDGLTSYQQPDHDT